MLGACAFAKSLPVNVGAPCGDGSPRCWQWRGFPITPATVQQRNWHHDRFGGRWRRRRRFPPGHGLGLVTRGDRILRAGLIVFAVFCALALTGLRTVKHRWRSTWGSMAAARV